jgi:M6 family metalloprotease-like protein
MEDGTSRTVRQRGDEFFNWSEAEDGFAVVRGVSGRWQYATRAKGRWVPAGMTRAQRGLEGRASDPPSRTSLFALAAATDGSSAAGTLSTTPVTTLATPPTPTNLVIILVSFADMAISTTASEWNTKFFGASGKTVKTFYKQASKDRFWFNPANETQGTTNDGVISVTLAINHPNETAPTALTQAAVSAALTAADPYINYAAFNGDGNAYLSTPELHLVLVFAGYEYAYSSAYTPAIWAHHWSLSSPPRLDGITLGSATGGGGYAAFGEYHTTHVATIGVICHELGHNLNLPDLYDTDNSSDGVGTHCLMGAGNWGSAYGEPYQGQTPVLPSAYCRQFLGFSDVQTASGAGGVYSLIQVSDSTNLADMVRLNTPDSKQYFLVENRRVSGFDAGLYTYTGSSSGGGLAVWHIDENMSNNDTDTQRLVDLEEAASPVLDVPGLPLGRLQNYYYAGNATRFDETTWPSNTLNGGAVSLTRVYNVSASGAQMTFTGDNGASLITLAEALDVAQTQAFTTGTPAWKWQTATTHDSSDAAQSGTISSSAKTSYFSTVVTGPVQVAYWWKHAANGTETLRFLLDGAPLVSTGVTNWTQQSHTVSTGVHTGRWEFVTTRSKNQGSTSAAYVDQLTVTPLTAALAVSGPTLSFPWTGGTAQIAVRNTGNTALLWRTATAAWCPLSPTNGTLAAGATQQVAVACATNWVRLVPRSGTLTVTATNAFGVVVSGSPTALPLSQAGRPANPATVFRVQ